MKKKHNNSEVDRKNDGEGKKTEFCYERENGGKDVNAKEWERDTRTEK